MELQFFKYKIPFSNPFRTASGTFKNREGIIIQLKKNGITALGEASPLPGFSDESLQQVIHELQSHYPEIQTHFSSSFSLKSTCNFLESFSSAPSLQFGLLTTATTFLAQQRGISLQQLLFQIEQPSVPVNAVLGTGRQNRTKEIAQAVKDGYETIKLKVDSNFSETIHLIENIRSKYPYLRVRIDANQSWSLEQATTCLSKLQPYQIEYCEEPLREPDTKSIQDLKEYCSVPVALDESILHDFTISQSFEIAEVIISKPMLWGLKYMSDEIIDMAKHSTKNLIFTTSLEGSIGRLMTAALAAGLGNSEHAHGLDTGQMLAVDVWDDYHFIKNGQFYLPDADRLKSLMNTKLLDLDLQEILI